MATPASAAATASDIVVLDVGGTKFKTTRTTLVGAQGGGTFFGRMFCVENKAISVAQPDGSYFIDRCPRAFEHILSGLRNNYIKETHNDIPKEIWKRELDFYGIGPTPSANNDESSDYNEDAKDSDSEVERHRKIKKRKLTDEINARISRLSELAANFIKETPRYKSLIKTTKKHYISILIMRGDYTLKCGDGDDDEEEDCAEFLRTLDGQPSPETQKRGLAVIARVLQARRVSVSDLYNGGKRAKELVFNVPALDGVSAVRSNRSSKMHIIVRVTMHFD